MVRIVVSIIVAAMLSGCGPTWYKPGATDIDLRIDKVRCEQEALAKIGKNEVTIVISPGYNTQPTMSCSGGASAIPGQVMMSCSGDQGKYVPPATVTIDTVEGMRDSYVSACLQNNGWYQKRGDEDVDLTRPRNDRVNSPSAQPSPAPVQRIAGTANGHITETYSWGGSFEGEFINGVRNGHGVYTYADGSKFEGEWRDGKRNGHAVETDKYGNRQEAEYLNGMLLSR